MTGTRAPLWTCLSLLASGCVFEAPEGGDLVVPACEPEDSDPTVDVSWAEDVHPILIENCLCHQPTRYPTPIGFQMSGLNVETYETFRRGGANTGERVVIPGDPCGSFVIQKTSASPPFGARMPLFQPGLPEPTRQTLHDWIAEGAQDD